MTAQPSPHIRFRRAIDARSIPLAELTAREARRLRLRSKLMRRSGRSRPCFSYLIFPEGWRASTPVAEDVENEEKFRACIGIDYSDLTRAGYARSQDFATDSAEASLEAFVFADAEQARAALDEFAAGMRGPDAEDCVTDSPSESAAEEDQEFEVEEVDLGELNVSPADVEDTSAWQFAIRLKFTSGAAEGLTPTVYLDMVHLREGDMIATLEVVDVFSSFDRGLRDELLEATAGRMSE